MLSYTRPNRANGLLKIHRDGHTVSRAVFKSRFLAAATGMGRFFTFLRRPLLGGESNRLTHGFAAVRKAITRLENNVCSVG